MTEQPTPTPNKPKKEYTPRRVTNQQKQQRHEKNQIEQDYRNVN